MAKAKPNKDVEIKAFTPAFLFFIPHKRWMIPKAKPDNVTCWGFKQKLQQIMKSNLKRPLTRVIHVDEFVIGGPEKGKRGKSKGLKKLIVLANEIVEGRVGRAYAEVIEHSYAVDLGVFLIKYVSREAEVVSDKWKGYTPLKKEFKNLKQVASEDGKNFKELIIHIMNIKGWLRGIHHHCSKERRQNYLDEYHFKYNRRSNMDTVFDVLIRKMVNYKVKPIK